jgi:hypothetical protein
VPLDLARNRTALARQQFEQQALADAVAANQGSACSGQGKGKGLRTCTKGQLQLFDMTCDMGHLNSFGPMPKQQAKSHSQMTGTRVHRLEKQRSQHQPVTVRRTRSPGRERN